MLVDDCWWATWLLTNNNMLSSIQLANVFPDGCASDACMAPDAHVVSKCIDHLFNLVHQLMSGSQNERLALGQGDVNLLQDGGRKRCGFTSARLGLWETKLSQIAVAFSCCCYCRCCCCCSYCLLFFVAVPIVITYCCCCCVRCCYCYCCYCCFCCWWWWWMMM